MMDIKYVIIKNDKVFGCGIQDGEYTQNIRIEALHNPIILKGLLDDGWQLYDTKYDLRRNGISLDQLQKVDYTSLNLTDDDIQIMLDMVSDIWSEEELKPLITKDITTKYIEFNKPIITIDTREKLLEFLEESDKYPNRDTITQLLPLNSFVSKEALFTPEEYFSNEYSKYRKLIEKRRVLSLAQLKYLQDYFNAFNMKEFVDKYFSWGICGMRLKVLDIHKTVDNIYSLNALVTEKTQEYARLYNNFLQYIDSYGEVKPKGLQVYKPVLQDRLVQSRVRELGALGENYIEPILTRIPVREERTFISAEDVEIEYNDSTIKVSYNNETYLLSTITVKLINSSTLDIPSSYFNLRNEKELYRYITLRAIVKELQSNLTVPSDVSSLQALEAVGCSLYSALKYMLYRSDIAELIYANTKLNNEISLNDKRYKIDDILEKYLHSRGFELITDTKDEEERELIDAVIEWVGNVKDGTYNIDSIAEGQHIDESYSMEYIMEYLQIATKYMGISIEQIYAQVRAIDIKNPFLEFDNGTNRMRLVLSKLDNKDTGYKKDIESYACEQARSADTWLYVLEVFTEAVTSADEVPRHVGLRCLSVYRGRKGTTYEKQRAKEVDLAITWLVKHISDSIEENVIGEVKQKYQQSRIYRIAGSAFFQIYMQGVCTLPKDIGGTSLDIPEDILRYIRNSVDEVIDSTIAFTEFAVIDASFASYVVNAIITPEYVLPRKGCVLKETQFIPMWRNTRGHDDLRINFYTRGMIPSIEFKGYRPLYRDKSYILYNDIATDNASLERYYLDILKYRKEYPDNRLFVRPKHPAEYMYAQLDPDNTNDTDEEDDKLVVDYVTKKNWHIIAIRNITYNDICKRNIKLKRFFDYGIAKRLDSKLNLFNSYNLADLLVTDNLSQLGVYKLFSKDSVYVLNILDRETFLLTNGEELKLKDIPNIDKDKYAIQKLQDNRYLLYSYQGEVYEVEVI